LREPVSVDDSPQDDVAALVDRREIFGPQTLEPVPALFARSMLRSRSHPGRVYPDPLALSLAAALRAPAAACRHDGIG
jgi:hypothetical protein